MAVGEDLTCPDSEGGPADRDVARVRPCPPAGDRPLFPAERALGFLRDARRFRAGPSPHAVLGRHGDHRRIETPEVARAILASGLPTIALDLSEDQLRPDHRLSRLSEVASDSRGAARMAAEHLLERGFRHYAFVGVRGRVWSDRREEGFCDRVREAGLEPHIYEPPRATAGSRLGARAARPGALARAAAPPDRPDGLQRRPGPRGPGGLPRRRAPRAGGGGRGRGGQ